MKRYVILGVALVLLTVMAIAVIPASQPYAEAITDDGVKIRMYISSWTPLSAEDSAFRVAFTYTGGHGSGGKLTANVPRLDSDATAYQYRSAAINAMVDVIVEREAEMTRLDESNSMWETLKNYTGYVGGLTLR